jgi:hypothetical protein
MSNNQVYVLQNDGGGFYAQGDTFPHGVVYVSTDAKVFETHEEAQSVLDDCFEDYTDFAFFICKYKSIEEFYAEQDDDDILLEIIKPNKH